MIRARTLLDDGVVVVADVRCDEAPAAQGLEETARAMEVLFPSTASSSGQSGGQDREEARRARSATRAARSFSGRASRTGWHTQPAVATGRS